MNLSDLESLLANISLHGAMPSPVLRFANKKCGIRLGANRHNAHAHCREGKHKGWICFEPSSLEAPYREVVILLAHELSHLRFPTARHNSTRFNMGLAQFYVELIR